MIKRCLLEGIFIIIIMGIRVFSLFDVGVVVVAVAVLFGLSNV